METKLMKAKSVRRLGKVVKYFVRETGAGEAVNFKLQWPLKVL